MMRKDDEDSRTKTSDKSSNQAFSQLDFSKYQSFIEEVVYYFFKFRNQKILILQNTFLLVLRTQ